MTSTSTVSMLSVTSPVTSKITSKLQADLVKLNLLNNNIDPNSAKAKIIKALMKVKAAKEKLDKLQKSENEEYLSDPTKLVIRRNKIKIASKNLDIANVNVNKVKQEVNMDAEMKRYDDLIKKLLKDKELVERMNDELQKRMSPQKDLNKNLRTQTSLTRGGSANKLK